MPGKGIFRIHIIRMKYIETEISNKTCLADQLPLYHPFLPATTTYLVLLFLPIAFHNRLVLLQNTKQYVPNKFTPDIVNPSPRIPTTTAASLIQCPSSNTIPRGTVTSKVS